MILIGSRAINKKFWTKIKVKLESGQYLHVEYNIIGFLYIFLVPSTLFLKAMNSSIDRNIFPVK